MPQIALHAFGSKPVTVESVAASIDRQTVSRLQLEYCVRAAMAGLCIPPAKTASRRDELWKHTCAELFVGGRYERAYCEFNFSPSGEWAAYEFSAYRDGMRELALSAPQIRCTQTPHEIKLAVSLDLPTHWLQRELDLGVTMVLQHDDQTHSYWALKHVAPQPDFHRRESFILAL